MLDITRMLTDKKFRKETIGYCNDVVVRQFWNVEFASWSEKFQTEAIAPVLNKVGAFTANPIIRNIIGQTHSSFNIRQIMDEGKILVVNLSKGLIGEDNAGILGSFLVTKIQLAAMSRSDILDIHDRRPFYLYVDEFQNFATDSFATILSEARKYGLNLTVANQYISQMEPTVRDAVFGNVGTMISFRVSPDDSPILAKQFEPQFEENDLTQMHNRNFIINMVINGEKAPAFSATTLNLPEAKRSHLSRIIEHSRELYSQSRQMVEDTINERIHPGSTGVSVTLAGQAGASAAASATATGEGTAKRRRRRRRKPANGEARDEQAAAEPSSAKPDKQAKKPAAPSKAAKSTTPSPNKKPASTAPKPAVPRDPSLLSIQHAKPRTTIPTQLLHHQPHTVQPQPNGPMPLAKQPDSATSAHAHDELDDPTFFALR